MVIPQKEGKRDGDGKRMYCMLGGMDVKTDEELLEECDVETYCASGPGGQNVNRRSTAVRLRHRPSGIVVTCQQERSQLRNKLIALELLREKLRRRAVRVKPRVKTKKSRGAKERILKKKKERGEIKKQRRKVE